MSSGRNADSKNYAIISKFTVLKALRVLQLLRIVYVCVYVTLTRSTIHYSYDDGTEWKNKKKNSKTRNECM